MDFDPKVEVAVLKERMIATQAILQQGISASHTRQDKLELFVKDELGKMTSSFGELTIEIKGINAWMNRSKGWGAAALFLAGIIGGLLTKWIIK